MNPELRELFRRIWCSVEEATAQRTPFTLGYLGTVGPFGTPRVRAVVLRSFEPEGKSVMFATNAQSAKIAEIRANRAVALTLNDDASAVQLRLEGSAEVVTDASVREQAWASFGPHTRHLYKSSRRPGTVLPDNRTRADLTLVESGDGSRDFDRFALVRITPHTADWLDLSAREHMRCRFMLEKDGWVGHRVVP